MAVPKKKTSRHRIGNRRSHDMLNRVNFVQDKHTGEFTLPHHLTPEEKYYKGKKVVKDKTEKTQDSKN